jgi:cyclophilin family peptidyl-prolyl cis-trans isomerase
MMERGSILLLILLGVSAISAPSMAEITNVTIMTNYGDIGLGLFPDDAPITVANFLEYVNADFYDGLIFHRVIEDFVIQAGSYDVDLNYHAPVRDPIINEFGRSNLRGTIAMAKLAGDPHSATSQFFFNLVDNGGPPAYLDIQNGGFTVFGEVVSGISVVDAIAQVSTHYVSPGLDNVPDDPVIIYNIVPEPATLILFGLGGLMVRRRR